MIIWLASYPKSGNTLLRSMLASYLFTEDGVYNFSLIKNIKQFPHGGLFIKLGVDLSNHNETIRNYIPAQQSFNKKDKIQFLKTHSYLFNFNKEFPFTDLNNTLGVIYIVRDPRNVVTSFSKFLNIPVEETANFMIKGSGDGLSWTSNWSNNFNSWKIFENYKRYLLLKYEDLVNEPESSFLKVLKFIHKLKKIDFKLDEKKFKKVIETTKFEKMKKLEQDQGFSEAKTNEKTGEKIPFFNLGPKNNWKKLLESKTQIKLEKAFHNEMKELGYL